MDKRLIGLAGATIAMAGCMGGMHRDDTEARAVVVITADDARASDGNQRTKRAGIACTPGSTARVTVELTGKAGPPADAVIGLALCDSAEVARAQATARPPSGYDIDRGSGTQVEGAATCQASWIVTPSENPPVWTVTCSFD